MAIALLASGCASWEKVGKDPSSVPGGCPEFNLAVNNWVGYEANAAVIAYVAETKLGCTVTKKNLDEQVAWQGFADGKIDAVVENWGHDDLIAKYITKQRVAQLAGPTGNQGKIGWYLPPWLAKAHPDLTKWQNLNKHDDMFRTSESDGKGQLLDGDPGFVTNDAALVSNLHLNFKVVYAGSEAALITTLKQAERNHDPVIAYFFEPHWFTTEVPLVPVELPKYTTGCDADPAKVACAYPNYKLNKVVSNKFAESGSPAYDLVKKFHWTNKDQNQVAQYIAVDKMTPEAAAKKWVDAHPAKVKAWLK
ncbi:ABC transporter substrate-binding protein [Pengzhenrongella sp.]|uniref:ABC transporter substrate-binding protein n=1 Tax=Pengzhenrongella sp. TaxID=2888820 RepID=UPI002F94C742